MADTNGKLGGSALTVDIDRGAQATIVSLHMDRSPPIPLDIGKTLVAKLPANESLGDYTFCVNNGSGGLFRTGDDMPEGWTPLCTFVQQHGRWVTQIVSDYEAATTVGQRQAQYA